MSDVLKRPRSDSEAKDIDQSIGKKVKEDNDTESEELSYDLPSDSFESVAGSSVITTESLYDSPWFRNTDLDEWTYENQAALAPMVRVCTLPFRLLAKNYGCQIMYSEEMVAKKVARCERMIGPNGLISFVEKDKNTGRKPTEADIANTVGSFLGSDESAVPYNDSKHVNLSNPTLVTYPHERLVLQLGASNGVEALEAARVLERDVRAFDLNMGCPKLFSLQGAMGAALLTKPEVVEDIIKTLVRNVNKPITAKIRMLPDVRQTVELVRMLESLGVSAIGVHARYPEDKPRFRALPLAQLPTVTSAVGVPVLCNGDVFTWNDINRFRVATHSSSVLIARGAVFNPSIFGGNGRLMLDDGIKPYYSGIEAGDDIDVTGYIDDSYTKALDMYTSALEPAHRPLTPLDEIPAVLGRATVGGSTYSRVLVSDLPNVDTEPLRTSVDKTQFDWKWEDEDIYVATCRSNSNPTNHDGANHNLHMKPVFISAYQYLLFSQSVGNSVTNAKYTLGEMLKSHIRATTHESYIKIQTAKTYIQLQVALAAYINLESIASTYAHPHPPFRFSARPEAGDKATWKSKREKTEINLLTKQ